MDSFFENVTVSKLKCISSFSVIYTKDNNP